MTLEDIIKGGYVKIPKLSKYINNSVKWRISAVQKNFDFQVETDTSRPTNRGGMQLMQFLRDAFKILKLKSVSYITQYLKSWIN